MLPARRSARWTLTLPFLTSGTLRQWADVADTPQQRLVRRREAAHAHRVEARMVREYDAVFTVCEDDAAGLPGPSIVVPNGVDAHRYLPTPVTASTDIVFVGRLNFLPNVDGVTWFADEVFPLVRARCPGARFVIVGLDPAPEVRALTARPGVVLHADVPDTRPHLAAARVAVVPLRLGTGTRLKALEALAAGRPLVGTSVGLAGLGLSPAEAVVVDPPEQMAQRIVELMSDDDTAVRLAAAGRRLIEARYTWEHVASAFVDGVLGRDRDAGVTVGAAGVGGQ